MQRTNGVLAKGKVADFCIWDIAEPAELAYRIGFNPLDRCVRAGEEDLAVYHEV